MSKWWQNAHFWVNYPGRIANIWLTLFLFKYNFLTERKFGLNENRHCSFKLPIEVPIFKSALICRKSCVIIAVLMRSWGLWGEWSICLSSHRLPVLCAVAYAHQVHDPRVWTFASGRENCGCFWRDRSPVCFFWLICACLRESVIWCVSSNHLSGTEHLWSCRKHIHCTDKE